MANSLRAVKINLTPSSDRNAEQTTPTSPTGLFAQRLAGTQGLSSTCASVDSDSDYQDGGSSVYGGESTSTPAANSSRPLSRTSNLSGVSTTATKDGVEGNRIRKSHDPLGYKKWMSSALADDISSSASSSTTSVSLNENPFGAGDERQAHNNEAMDASNSPSTKSPHQQQLQLHQQETLNEYVPTPPNDPRAPPITLTEKIRLLRTGSVSRKGPPETEV